jgi:DNA processing protein
MSSSISPKVRDLLALHLVPGIGPRLTAALLEQFGSAEAVLRASAAELQEVPLIGPKLAQNLLHAREGNELAEEIERIERYRVNLLTLGTPEYPASLSSIPDAPHLLYVRGTLTEADANAVALVGSRGCTEYGRRVAARLASGLVRAGVTIVSGLARGIDGAAHRAALEAGGRTIAVLAGGLSRIYPPEHGELANTVMTSGALVTESRMEQEPQAGMFPARNRLISGLSKVVVIVEAGDHSGALYTAVHAAEQGRTVMAVPGNVDSDASGGTNALIRQGAVLCRSVEDVLEELHGVSAVAQVAKAAEKEGAPAPVAQAAPVANPPPTLDETQRRVWDFLADGARTLDEVAQQLALGVPQLSVVLMMLEMKKAARRLPGNRYERC